RCPLALLAFAFSNSTVYARPIYFFFLRMQSMHMVLCLYDIHVRHDNMSSCQLCSNASTKVWQLMPGLCTTKMIWLPL
ncbi:hypothetical protein EDB84DRAFT_1502584, partial [Lactarius hengduanensis]